MRAATLSSTPATPGVIDLDIPRPDRGEVLVRVGAASVNGFDLSTAAGHLHGMMEHRFPLVVGKDFAGTVEAVGREVEAFSVGDPVFGVVMKPFLGEGSLAEFVTVPAAHGLARIPEGLDVRTAGALGLAGTAAHDSVSAVGLQQGETVLISGATGGVGALAVQFAANRGAQIIATARPGAEADFVTDLTDLPIEIIDYCGDLEAQVRTLAPNGVDAVLHLAGDGDQLANLLRPGGRIASTLMFVPEGRDVIAHPVMADPTATTLTQLAADAASGTLTVPITATYPLEKAAEAFAAFSAGTLGKISIAIN